MSNLFTKPLVKNKCMPEYLKLIIKNTSSDSGPNNDLKKLKLPDAPTNCCEGGCENCVWIEYAQELTELINDGGDKARKKIMENVKDPSVRAFVLMELDKMLKQKK